MRNILNWIDFFFLLKYEKCHRVSLFLSLIHLTCPSEIPVAASLQNICIFFYGLDVIKLNKTY